MIFKKILLLLQFEEIYLYKMNKKETVSLVYTVIFRVYKAYTQDP